MSVIQYSYILVDLLSSFTSRRDIRKALAFCKDCGYDGIELNLDQPLGVDLDDLQRWVSELGLTVPAFLTGAAYSRNLCLCSPSEKARRGAVERLIAYLEPARRFEAILVVGLIQGLRSDEPDAEVAQRRIADCLRAVCAAARDKGVQIVLEPVNHLQVGFNNSVAEVLDLIETVDSPALKPMVDTLHMNIEEESLTQPILDCGSDLRHVHLCESNAGLFGSGGVDFKRVLSTLEEIGYEGFASVKVYRKATLEEAARTSIEFLASL